MRPEFSTALSPGDVKTRRLPQIRGKSSAALVRRAPPRKDDYMITNGTTERIRGWFSGRIPQQWGSESIQVEVDRDEITVTLTLPDVRLDDGTSDAEAAEARAGRAKAFREETRPARMGIAREAQHRFERTVSWAVMVGDRKELFTHLSAPVMTRLRQPQRQVLDTLIDAGVARSRSEALAWCVRLVEEHADTWLTELREAMSHVADVRDKGPAGGVASS
jgi:hypothetical protein